MPTIATVTMTSEAKRALAKTIRGLRGRLIEELGAAMERAYLLSIDAKKAHLDEAARVKRARLERAIEEQVRGHTDKGAKEAAAARLRAEVVTDAAATLLVRLVYLRLLEASGLVAVKVVTGGWASRGYRDFCEVAPELVRADETEGYAALLGLVFDELAHELPGLYGPVRMTSLVPVPAATLRAVIEALNDPELATVWTDDTALGWIYQYWNDPERERLDAKLAAAKKLENHEIASKTQMFTERYMVEWLLQNTLGQMWLAMCKQHGWHAEAEASGVLERLEERRIAWRARREAGEVALDALMPIEPGLEERWKYWVPQPLPDDAVASAPASVRDLTLLDPACGSGHFLVIACDLLFALYQEEARHRGEVWSDREIVESILERNLHGLDIDPKAVQLAAAALMLKARQLCAQAEPRTLNLVAPAFSLARLPGQDPALRELYAAVKDETGIPEALTATIVGALAGADHLGTLLKVDAAIDAAIEQYGAQLSAAVPSRADQGDLFTGHQPKRRKRITAETAKAAVLDRLEAFLRHHTGGADLGLRLRGEQLAAGVRFVRLVREGQYDLVIGNPPYQGTSKLADKAYVEKEYPRGKADLYAAFLERGLQLVKPGGVSALLTMRNWMFIKQFSALREWLLATYDLRMLGDVDRGAFEEMKDNPVTISVVRRSSPALAPSIALSPSDPTARVRTLEHYDSLAAGLLCQVGRYDYDTSLARLVPEAPVLYWWNERDAKTYIEVPKLGRLAQVRQGCATANNARFLRSPWEVERRDVSAVRWTEARAAVRGSSMGPVCEGRRGPPMVRGLRSGGAMGHARTPDRSGARGSDTVRTRSELPTRSLYFACGVAFTMIGDAFLARAHRIGA
jgi:hypothetical protein